MLKDERSVKGYNESKKIETKFYMTTRQSSSKEIATSCR